MDSRNTPDGLGVVCNVGFPLPGCTCIKVQCAARFMASQPRIISNPDRTTPENNKFYGPVPGSDRTKEIYNQPQSEQFQTTKRT